MPLNVQAIGYRRTGRGSGLELPLEEGEQFYGLGMNLKVFQLWGGKKVVRVSDDQTTVLGDSHAPAPFYVSTRGYGVYVDTARYASFYFGNLNAVREGLAESNSKMPGPIERDRSPQLTKHFVGVDVPSARGVDVYLFAGPDMRHAVQRYNFFSGGGCLPPMWGLGVWYRAATELDQQEVLSFLSEFRRQHIPCDVFGLEPGWHTATLPLLVRLEPGQFSRPRRAAPRDRRQGYKLNLWEHCFTHPISPLYKPLVPWSGDYKVWGGLVPDFATPEARKIFADHHAKTARRQGCQRLQARRMRSSAVERRPLVVPRAGGLPLRAGRRADAPADRPPLSADDAGCHYRQQNQRTLRPGAGQRRLAAPLPFALYSDAYEHAITSAPSPPRVSPASALVPGSPRHGLAGRILPPPGDMRVFRAHAGRLLVPEKSRSGSRSTPI